MNNMPLAGIESEAILIPLFTLFRTRLAFACSDLTPERPSAWQKWLTSIFA